MPKLPAFQSPGGAAANNNPMDCPGSHFVPSSPRTSSLAVAIHHSHTYERARVCWDGKGATP